MQRGHNANAIANGNLHFQRFVEDMLNEVSDIRTIISKSASSPTNTAQAATKPPAATFTVVGQDGAYLVTITNPEDQVAPSASIDKRWLSEDRNQLRRRILHQLQSATDTNFNANSNTTTYGPSEKLYWDISDPNMTKYWRLRSSYDGQLWNPWIYLEDPAVCGVSPVWSGLVRNSSSSLVDSATTPSGGNPCTQHLTTTSVDVAASVWQCGDQSGSKAIHYSSGFVDPGSYGTWLIYAKDPKRAGGVVTFLATNSSDVVTSDNANIYFGKITTAAGGGGTGGGGGGGTCCRGSVPVTMFDGSKKLYADLRLGDVLRGADGGPEVVQRIVMHPGIPCFHLEFDVNGVLTDKQYIGAFTVYQIELDRSHTFLAGSNRVIDGAASSHPIQRLSGGFVKVFEALPDETFKIIDGAIGSHNLIK